MSRSSLRIAFGLVLAVVLAWGMSLDTRAAATAAANAAATVVNGGAVPAGTPAGEPEPIPSRSLAGVFMTDAAAADAAQGQGKGKGQAKPGKPTKDQVFVAKFQKVAPSEQKAASKRLADLGMKAGAAGLTDIVAADAFAPLPGMEGPGGVPHYFGPYGNWAFSPMPSFGLLPDVTIVAGGTGYSANPTVTITDVYGTGVAAAAATVDANGVITGITVAPGSSGFHVPFVTISDPTGTGAEATAELDLTTLAGGIPKFTDPLPGLWDPRGGGTPPAKAIPLGVPDVVTYPGSDYYEIGLQEYEESFHSTLPPTRLRGYVQLNNGTNLYDSVSNPTGCVTAAPIPAGSHECTAADNTIAPAPIRYLGPVIVAHGRVHGIQVDGVADAGDPRPVRVRFVNQLPIGPPDPTTGRRPGDLFLPVDETVPGSGYGPAGPGGAGDKYTQNRATIHLHGNNTVWLSDGNTHQWITPANESTPYPAGTSARNVPDMPGCASDPANPLLPGSSGCMTFYYTNAQSARLQFYHDHAHGITRLNVYAGEAGGYLVTDAVEQDLVNGTNVTGVNVSKTSSNKCVVPTDDANQNGILDPGECAQVLPGLGTPLIIQDKTFVDAETVYAQDPTWNWGTAGPGVARTGDLWYPHVYMTVQNPWDLTGTNGYGRWHYGPWFNPPTPECINGGPVGCIEVGPVPNEYYQPICETDPNSPACTAPWEPPMRPGVPNPSIPGESFLDTPIVNGTAYPYLQVEPRAYRFRILNAANDRFWNLQLYVAADKKTPTTPGTVGTVLCDGTTGVPVGDCTEVKMVPVSVNPANQYADTPSGIPDPATKGPDWIHIGTEGGFLPRPNVIPPMPIGYNLDPAYFAYGIVNQHSLFLGSAERADVIVDFSQYAGKTLILYNDSPAPVPAGAAPYDNYTGDGDGVDGGGAPNTQPGYGPNTRTIMQIQVAAQALPDPPTDPLPPLPSYDLAKLEAVWAKTALKPGVFETSQDPIIVPQAAYNSAYNASYPTNASQYILNVQDTQKTFQPIDRFGVPGPAVTIPIEMKAMHDEMGGVYDTMFGRMSGMLGLTNPNSPVHVLIPYGYSSPPTDVVKGSIEFTPIGSLADGTQIWRIFHNGVDTHPIHTHLFHAQLIDRVGQDGQVTPGPLPAGQAVDAIDLGWKDTIRINPLEITFLALRPTVPTPDQVPFEVPDSIRLIDPGLPEGANLIPPAPAGWFDPLGNPIADLRNHTVNFGWEYVWHCHILSHEEMDFMHALAFAVPPKPATLAQPTVSGNQNNRTVTLSWTDGSMKELGYQVERATNPTFTTGRTVFPSATTYLPANTTTYQNTRVPNNAAYWYRVIAVGQTVGDVSLANFPTMSADSVSNVQTVTVGTASSGLPANPGPTLTATVQAGPQVSLTFTDNATNETGFTVERCTGTACSAFAPIATIGPRTSTGSVTYVDATVTAGNSYSYRVWAVNAIGSSALPTNVATAVVAAVPTAPVGATLSVARSGGGQTPYTATLNWNWPDTANGSNPANFTVQRATDLNFTQNLTTTTVAGGLRTLTQTRQLRANTVYYFRVRANNGGGSSAWTNVLPFPIRTGN